MLESPSHVDHNVHEAHAMSASLSCSYGRGLVAWEEQNLPTMPPSTTLGPVHCTTACAVCHAPME